MVRKTVRIDEALLSRIRRLAPARGFNQFVNEALIAQIDAIERAYIERDMADGHIATRDDRESLNRDWEVLDGEGWPAAR